MARVLFHRRRRPRSPSGSRRRWLRAIRTDDPATAVRDRRLIGHGRSRHRQPERPGGRGRRKGSDVARDLCRLCQGERLSSRRRRPRRCAQPLSCAGDAAAQPLEPRRRLDDRRRICHAQRYPGRHHLPLPCPRRESRIGPGSGPLRSVPREDRRRSSRGRPRDRRRHGRMGQRAGAAPLSAHPSDPAGYGPHLRDRIPRSRRARLCLHVRMKCQEDEPRRLAMSRINTPQEVDHDRRRLIGTAAMTVAAAQLGMTGFAQAQASKTKLPSIKPGTNTSFGPLKQVDAGLLTRGCAEAGPADGAPVVLLHGWPYDIYSFVDVAPLLASAGYRVIVPYLRGYGSTRFLSADTFRNAQPAAVALDIIALIDALRIEKPIICAFDWGARTGCVIAALWPERCKALVSVSGYITGGQEAGKIPLPPKGEFDWWYQFYFATERGRAGYDKYRRDFNKLDRKSVV